MKTAISALWLLTQGRAFWVTGLTVTRISVWPQTLSSSSQASVSGATIEAKPADAQGALAFEANYSAGQEGNSGWRKFNLKPGYDSYSFEWDVPVRRIADQAVDYLAIRPVVPEKHRAVEIRSIKFERLARTDVKPE